MNKGLFTSKTPEWETPQGLFDRLNKQYKFNLDPCATKENAKCKKFYTEEDDGLAQDWSGKRVFMNPPYGRVIGNWIKKAAEGGAEIVVCLLPARTDTRWFHDYIYGKTAIQFIKGRVHFRSGDIKAPAPFPSMIVIFKSNETHQPR